MKTMKLAILGKKEKKKRSKFMYYAKIPLSQKALNMNSNPLL